jgi:hypothetical protein
LAEQDFFTQIKYLHKKFLKKFTTTFLTCDIIKCHPTKPATTHKANVSPSLKCLLIVLLLTHCYWAVFQAHSHGYLAFKRQLIQLYRITKVTQRAFFNWIIGRTWRFLRLKLMEVNLREILLKWKRINLLSLFWCCFLWNGFNYQQWLSNYFIALMISSYRDRSWRNTSFLFYDYSLSNMIISRENCFENVVKGLMLVLNVVNYF